MVPDVVVPAHVKAAIRPGCLLRIGRFPYAGMTGSPAKIIASANGLYGSSRNPAWVPGGSSRAMSAAAAFLPPRPGPGPGRG